jgi:hypothetical protein
MVGLTLFAEPAAAIACGGLALSLAQVAALGRNLTMAAVGGAAGFFIGLVTQLGWPFLALPLAAGTMQVEHPARSSSCWGTSRPAATRRPSPFSKAAPDKLSSMARQSQLDSARLRRDLGLARARRFTIYAAIGATGFTGVLALVAATSFPGRTPATAPQPGSTDNTGNAPPGLVAPVQQPQYGYGGAPVAISGGS